MSKVEIPKKKRSQIIIDIIKNNIDVAQALETLDLLLQDINNDEIKNWVDKEINGYSQDDTIPDYRIVNAHVTGTVRTYTAIISKYNIPIPVKYSKDLEKITVTSGISEIMQLSVAEKESETHCLTMALPLQLINSIAQINGEVTHAYRELSVYAYSNIIGKLKSKILSICKELEKQYGNLDDYYIDFKNDDKEKETAKNIINIIFDKSIKIGDGNDISKSIVGDSNEY